MEVTKESCGVFYLLSRINLVVLAITVLFAAGYMYYKKSISFTVILTSLTPAIGYVVYSILYVMCVRNFSMDTPLGFDLFKSHEAEDFADMDKDVSHPEHEDTSSDGFSPYRVPSVIPSDVVKKLLEANGAEIPADAKIDSIKMSDLEIVSESSD